MNQGFAINNKKIQEIEEIIRGRLR